MSQRSSSSFRTSAAILQAQQLFKLGRRFLPPPNLLASLSVLLPVQVAVQSDLVDVKSDLVDVKSVLGDVKSDLVALFPASSSFQVDVKSVQVDVKSDLVALPPASSSVQVEAKSDLVDVKSVLGDVKSDLVALSPASSSVQVEAKSGSGEAARFLAALATELGVQPHSVAAVSSVIVPDPADTALSSRARTDAATRFSVSVASSVWLSSATSTSLPPCSTVPVSADVAPSSFQARTDVATLSSASVASSVSLSSSTSTLLAHRATLSVVDDVAGITPLHLDPSVRTPEFDTSERSPCSSCSTGSSRSPSESDTQSVSPCSPCSTGSSRSPNEFYTQPLPIPELTHLDTLFRRTRAEPHIYWQPLPCHFSSPRRHGVCSQIIGPLVHLVDAGTNTDPLSVLSEGRASQPAGSLIPSSEASSSPRFNRMSPFVNSVSLSCLACQLCLGWWLAPLTRIPIVAGGHVIDAVSDVAQCRWGRSMPSIPNIITSITLRRTVPRPQPPKDITAVDICDVAFLDVSDKSSLFVSFVSEGPTSSSSLASSSSSLSAAVAASLPANVNIIHVDQQVQTPGHHAVLELRERAVRRDQVARPKRPSCNRVLYGHSAISVMEPAVSVTSFLPASISSTTSSMPSSASAATATLLLNPPVLPAASVATTSSLTQPVACSSLAAPSRDQILEPPEYEPSDPELVDELGSVQDFDSEEDDAMSQPLESKTELQFRAFPPVSSVSSRAARRAAPPPLRMVPPNVQRHHAATSARSSVIGQPSQRPSSLRPSTMRVPPWYETKQEDIIRSVERMLTHVAQSPLATLLPAHLPFSGTILNQWLSNVITVASMFQLVPALNLVEALSNRIHGPLSSDLRIHHIGLIGLVARVFLRGSPKLADVRDQIAHLTMQEASMRDFRARLTELWDTLRYAEMCQSRTSNGGLGRLVASTSADFNDSGLFYLMKEEQESFHRGEDPLLSPLRDFLPALKDIQDYAPSEYFSKEFLAALKRAITLAHPTSYMLQLAIMDMQADPREILDSMDDWDDALPAPTTFPASAAVAAVTQVDPPARRRSLRGDRVSVPATTPAHAEYEDDEPIAPRWAKDVKWWPQRKADAEIFSQRYLSAYMNWCHDQDFTHQSDAELQQSVRRLRYCHCRRCLDYWANICGMFRKETRPSATRDGRGGRGRGSRNSGGSRRGRPSGQGDNDRDRPTNSRDVAVLDEQSSSPPVPTNNPSVSVLSPKFSAPSSS